MHYKGFFSILITFFLALFIIGCVTYDLSPKDEAWNPYEVGEKFTFVSDQGGERNFTISNIDKTKNRVNVYAGNLSRMKESLTVFATEDNTSEEVPILAIYKNSDDKSFINFTLNLSAILGVNHVEEIPEANAKLGNAAGFSGDDLLNINPVQNVGPGVEIPYVTNFIFSKSRGFVQFSLTNGEVWSLKQN